MKDDKVSANLICIGPKEVLDVAFETYGYQEVESEEFWLETLPSNLPYHFASKEYPFQIELYLNDGKAKFSVSWKSTNDQAYYGVTKVEVDLSRRRENQMIILAIIEEYSDEVNVEIERAVYVDVNRTDSRQKFQAEKVEREAGEFG